MTLNRNQQPQSLRYTPHPEQLKFHAGRDVWSQRAILAGTGAGKTLAGLSEDLAWSQRYPGSVGYIFEPNYPMVRRILLPTIATSLLLGESWETHPLIADYNKQDARVDFKNGSQWWFISLEEPENAEGPNIDYAHVDEARLVRHFDVAWKTILRRLRSSGRCRVSVKPSVWITTTPDYPGTPLFDTVENPLTKSPNIHAYRWSIYENPKLSRDFLSEIERSHTGSLAERFIYGRFAQVGSGSFPFDSTLHIKSVGREFLKEIRYGVDFGWTNPTAIIVLGFDSDDRAYVLEEIYKSQMGKEEILASLLEFKKTIGPGQIFCDPSGPETIEYLKRGGLNVQGNIFKREDGIRELGSRFQKAGDGQPRLFINSKCVNLISELLEYREDVKERDHAVDALRYAMKLKVSHPGGFVSFGVVGDK